MLSRHATEFHNDFQCDTFVSHTKKKVFPVPTSINNLWMTKNMKKLLEFVSIIWFPSVIISATTRPHVPRYLIIFHFYWRKHVTKLFHINLLRRKHFITIFLYTTPNKFSTKLIRMWKTPDKTRAQLKSKNCEIHSNTYAKLKVYKCIIYFWYALYVCLLQFLRSESLSRRFFFCGHRKYLYAPFTRTNTRRVTFSYFFCHFSFRFLFFYYVFYFIRVQPPE